MKTTSTNITQKNTSNVFSKINAWFQSNRTKINEKGKQALRTFCKFVKIFSKALAGAVIFAFMAELAPGLREQLPLFYEYVDLVLKCLEFFSTKAMEILHQFF